jgi:hypothetical protein
VLPTLYVAPQTLIPRGNIPSRKGVVVIASKIGMLARALSANAADPTKVLLIAEALSGYANALMEREREIVPPHLRHEADVISLEGWRAVR